MDSKTQHRDCSRYLRGFTRIEFALVLLILIPLFAVGYLFVGSRMQSQRNYEALEYPGKTYAAACSPSANVYSPGESVVLDITITNDSPHRVDMLWPDRFFLLTTDPNPPPNPGYPAPPISIPADNLKNVAIVNKSGLPVRDAESYKEIRLDPGESIAFNLDLGPAQGSGFQGKLLIEFPVYGIPGDAYDIRDPNQTFLHDGRSLITRSFAYKVTTATN